jgi:hypothetical protein
MTTYPGDDPQTPDDPDGTEPTQPVGYWERRANEQAAEQARAQGGQPYPTTPYPQGGPVFNPTSSLQNPYGQASYGQAPQGQAPRAQGPYAQPGPASYGGQPPAPGQPAPYAPMPPYGGLLVRPPDHDQATLSLILGLVGLIGSFVFCGVTLLVSPFAWGVGHSALKDIRASQGRLGGESNARTGMILGIIGTALLVLVLLIVIFAIVMSAATDTSSTGSSV